MKEERQSLLLLLGLICREIGEYIGGDMVPVTGTSFVRCCLKNFTMESVDKIEKLMYTKYAI